jgi:hypothetical protein
MDTESQLEVIEPLSFQVASSIHSIKLLKEIIRHTLLIDPIQVIDIFEQAFSRQSEGSTLQLH